MQRSALCRSRRELSNAYFLGKFGFDTAENEPCKFCPLTAYRSPKCGLLPADRSSGTRSLPRVSERRYIVGFFTCFLTSTLMIILQIDLNVIVESWISYIWYVISPVRDLGHAEFAAQRGVDRGRVASPPHRRLRPPWPGRGREFCFLGFFH